MANENIKYKEAEVIDFWKHALAKKPDNDNSNSWIANIVTTGGNPIASDPRSYSITQNLLNDPTFYDKKTYGSTPFTMNKNLQSGLQAGAGILGGIGAGINRSQVGSTELAAREGLRAGVSAINPLAGAITGGLDLLMDSTGKGLSTYDMKAADKAGVSKAASVGNNLLAAIPGLSFLGIAGKKTKSMYDRNQDQVASGYSIDENMRLNSGKTFLFGSGKMNDAIDKQNNLIKVTTDIGRENQKRKSSNSGLDLASQYFNKINGNQGNLQLAKHGMKLISLSEAKLFLSKIKNKSIESFKNGGKLNVIAEGALHSRKHNLEDVHEVFEDVTTKGIPVVLKSEGGVIKQVAEIEGGELILTYDVTKELESLLEDGSEEAMIKAGKLLSKQIIKMTDDKTNEIL